MQLPPSFHSPQAYEDRVKARAQGKTFSDTSSFHGRFPQSLPESLRPRPGQVSPLTHPLSTPPPDQLPGHRLLSHTIPSHPLLPGQRPDASRLRGLCQHPAVRSSPAWGGGGPWGAEVRQEAPGPRGVPRAVHAVAGVSASWYEALGVDWLVEVHPLIAWLPLTMQNCSDAAILAREAEGPGGDASALQQLLQV